MDTPSNAKCEPLKPHRREVTVGEALDERISAARKRVEQLCILKAKAEALNVLDHPYECYQDLAFL